MEGVYTSLGALIATVIREVYHEDTMSCIWIVQASIASNKVASGAH